jgi:type III secretion protein C
VFGRFGVTIISSVIFLCHSAQCGFAQNIHAMGKTKNLLPYIEQSILDAKKQEPTLSPTIRNIHPAKQDFNTVIQTQRTVNSDSVKQQITQQKTVKSPLDKKISYYVLQQTVALAVKDIATQLNLPVVIAPNVKGKVAAGKYKGTAREILDLMVADSNLHWFYDGRSIQVTSVQDAIMHIVQLNHYSFMNLEQALKQINFDTTAFPIRYDAINNMAIVYGPPKYVATIEVVASHLANRAMQKPGVIRG